MFATNVLFQVIGNADDATLELLSHPDLHQRIQTMHVHPDYERLIGMPRVAGIYQADMMLIELGETPTGDCYEGLLCTSLIRLVEPLYYPEPAIEQLMQLYLAHIQAGAWIDPNNQPLADQTALNILFQQRQIHWSLNRTTNRFAYHAVSVSDVQGGLWTTLEGRLSNYEVCAACNWSWDYPANAQNVCDETLLADTGWIRTSQHTWMCDICQRVYL